MPIVSDADSSMCFAHFHPLFISFFHFAPALVASEGGIWPYLLKYPPLQLLKNFHRFHIHLSVYIDFNLFISILDFHQLACGTLTDCLH